VAAQQCYSRCPFPPADACDCLAFPPAVYEPGLLEVVQGCRGRNLFFSTDTKKHVGEADVIFVRWGSCWEAAAAPMARAIPYA
jgi:hypothetical protein